MEHKNTQSYVVKPGDTMTAIAKKHNTTVDTLMKLNPQITDANRIYPGQVIMVPVAQGGHGGNGGHSGQGNHGWCGCPGQMPQQNFPSQMFPSMTFPTQQSQSPYPCFPPGNPCSGWSMPQQPTPYPSGQMPNNWWMNQQGMGYDNWNNMNPGMGNNTSWGDWNNTDWGNFANPANDTASIQQAPNARKRQK